MSLPESLNQAIARDRGLQHGVPETASVLKALSRVVKIVNGVNRLKGIGLVNSRVLVAGVFTAAFAGLAYTWPEIFGAWFGNYLGGAFVLLSVYNLGPGGFSQDAIKATGRAISDGVMDDAVSKQFRFASYFDGVKRAFGVNPLDPASGEHRILLLMDSLGVQVALPDRSILDTIVLKQGTNDWGWTHILAHSDDFKKLLGSGDPDAMQRWIESAVTAPDTHAIVNGEYRIARNFGTPSNALWVYVTANADGSITTAFPTKDIASYFP